MAKFRHHKKEIGNYLSLITKSWIYQVGTKLIDKLRKSGPANEVYYDPELLYRVMPDYFNTIAEFSPVNIIQTYYSDYLQIPSKGRMALIGIQPHKGMMREMKLVR